MDEYLLDAEADQIVDNPAGSGNMASPWDTIWNAINAIWDWIKSLWGWVQFNTRKIKELEKRVTDLEARVTALEAGGTGQSVSRPTIQLGPFRKQ